jgi:DNA-binding transcriptional LysR family regulator
VRNRVDRVRPAWRTGRSHGPCSLPIRDRLIARDPTFRPAFEISEDSAILGLVAQGLGVALMPELTLDAVPHRVRQVELDEPIERTIGVALPPGALKTPSVRAFLGTLRNLFPEGEVPHLSEQPVQPS